ncbi:MAG: outer membrane lipoprotein-sorting protein [Spirochaetes bacterium]|jgi:hypothetical protein|nr:outer membrane lipoprotein-sorting protein [Spirochaetota bacterium]
MIRFTTILFLFCTISTQNLFCDDDAYSIMQNHFNLKSTNSSIKSISLMLIDSSGRKLNRSFTEKSRSKKNKEYNYIEVIAPADIAGVRLLSTPSKDREEQHLFLPALGKSRLIAGSGSGGKGGRFLGSDICYYDIEVKKIDDAKYTYIKQEIIDERLFHVIDAVSIDSDCPYGKTRFWVSNNQWLIHRTECFEKKPAN